MRSQPVTLRESFIATSSRRTSFSPTSGQVKILDFGLAKVSRELDSGDGRPKEDLTLAGEIFGTAVYMSPEQARGEELDPRSDLFSLGAVLYQMATGKKPFAGTNVVTTLEAVLNQKPVSPLKLNPALPPDLEGILGRAMEKDRGNRYQNALAMKGDLQSLKKETEPELNQLRPLKPVLPYRIKTSTFQTTSKLQTYLLIGVSALLVLAVTAAAALWYKHRPGAGGAAKNTIAVLPLQNVNGDISVEFLRFALADEICQYAHLHADARRSSLFGHAKICDQRRRSTKSRPGTARRHRRDRTLPEAGRQSHGHAGGDRCAKQPAPLADQPHRIPLRTSSLCRTR